MKKLLLLGSAICATLSFGQTTIYQENFETGNSFTMNTTDLGGASTVNTWLMNNTYTGGSGTIVCLGFPFSFTIGNTPSQPGGIAGAPNSNYMHIASQSAVSSGITCASFAASDGGTCVSDESNFSRMTAPISTTGYTNVELDFYWLCVGGASSVGELYYSLDGGTTWTLKQSNFNNTAIWTQTTLSDPLWNNQSSLLFAFRFLNNTSPSALDPSFSVDEISVTGMTITNAITTDVQPTTSWCFGDISTMQVSFEATGAYNGGNVFTAELSDASGAFSAPTSVGTLSSSISGSQNITATIPGTISVGNGYRIRIVSSDPVTIGTDNGQDLSVLALPTVQFDSIPNICLNSPNYTLSEGSPAGGIYSGSGVSNGDFNPATAGVGTSILTYTYVDGNGCSATDTQEITVEGCADLDEMSNELVQIFPNPTSNKIIVQVDSQISTLELFDAQGNNVKKINKSNEMDVSQFNSGIYFLHVRMESGTSIKRVMIR